MFQSNNFRRFVMPLIIANSIVSTGLLEYFFNRTIRTIGYIYVTCCSVYYGILFYTFKEWLNIFEGSHGTYVTGILSTVSFFGNAFYYIVVIFDGLTRRKLIKLFIEPLEICTRRIDELDVSRNYSSPFQYYLIAGVLLIFLILGSIVTDLIWFHNIELSFSYSSMLQFLFFDNYPSIITMTIDFTFVLWIRYVKIHFAKLNDVLKSMLTTTNDSPQHKRVLRMKDNWESDSSLSTICRTYKTHENLVKLKKVKEIHLELIKCARIITKAYGLSILMSTTLSLLCIIILLYCLYTVVFVKEYDNQIIELFTLFSWISYFAIKTFTINNVCETTVMEALIFFIFLYASDTGEILYELYEPSASKKFRDEIRNFMFQLTQNRLTFTACGLYDLDRTFIYSAIGSITTYLVILIQIGDKPKFLLKNENNNSTL